MEAPYIWVLLAFIGLFIGAFGTLIGVAGGFLLVPILLFLYPDETPATITSITLTVAFFNALSGSIAYGRMKRIDYRSGLLFSTVAVPGAIAGAYVIDFLNRGVFQYIFGSLLLVVSAYLVLRPERKGATAGRVKWQANRDITDRQNNNYKYSYNLFIGMTIASLVGVIAGLLGIGGGIIHVPAMTQILFSRSISPRRLPILLWPSAPWRRLLLILLPGLIPAISEGWRCFPPGRSSGRSSARVCPRGSKPALSSGCWLWDWPSWHYAC